MRIENQLTYWVDGETEYNREDGYVRFSLSVDNKEVGRVITLFEGEIKSLKNKLLSEKEVANYVGKVDGDIQRLSINYNWLLRYYSRSASLLGKKEVEIYEFLENLSHITPEQIRDVSQKYFNDQNFAIALIANKNSLSSIPSFQ